MKELILKPENLRRIEFWAATTLFVFILFFSITNAIGTDINGVSTQHIKAPFDALLVSRLVRYLTIYCVFLILNFTIVPRLMRKEAPVVNTFLMILIVICLSIILGVTDTYLKAHLLRLFNTLQDAYNYIFQRSFVFAAWLLLLFGFYTVIKYSGLYLLVHGEAIQARFRFITPGAIVAVMFWLIGLLLLVAGGVLSTVTAIWTVVILSSILVYSYSYYFLIPASLKKRHPYRTYAWKIVVVLLLSILPSGFLALMITEDDDPAVAIGSLNAVFQLLLIVPLSWVSYKYFTKGSEEITMLKKELGQTHASFDFLRSQINPHFLFNALNTIYGTAIQEHAERTSESIEKLGGMMRFMIQENMQDQIALVREIDYLNDYISLQKLRTDPNPLIQIDTNIEQPLQCIQIAPMLLIPFVENAFKHGISFREPSQIRISLQLREHTLYFDVHNSKHMRLENDPEKYSNGIGLTNVKQRLQLLYHKRHELMIRETAKDFYVHLTIQLT